MTRLNTVPQSRIADLLRTENVEEMSLFAHALAEQLGGVTPQQALDGLRGAARSFLDPDQHLKVHVRMVFDAREDGTPLPPRPAYVPAPITWPSLLRGPHGYALDTPDGSPLPGLKDYRPLDWLIPGWDDVTLVVWLFQSEVEAEVFLRAWDSARPAPGTGADFGKYGVSMRSFGDGVAVVTWMHDPRNLMIWRDERPYMDSKLLAAIGPGGHIIERDDLPDDIQDTLAIDG